MNKISNLSDLLIDNLKKIYSSEQLQQSSLNELRQKASTPALRNAISSYSRAKEQNLNRLRDCFSELNVPARGHKCPVTQTLLEECRSHISQAAESHVRDAELVCTVQKLNHLNITSYGTAASFAKTLDKNKVAGILHDALLDEKASDDKLSDIAEATINPSAVLTA